MISFATSSCPITTRNQRSPSVITRSFINILITHRTKIMLYGCPVGTLCTELAKLEHAAQPMANKVLGLFRDWLTGQFAQLVSDEEAEPLALHVLAWSQGVATLANAFRDETFIRREVRQLENWLAAVSAGARAT